MKKIVVGLIAVLAFQLNAQVEISDQPKSDGKYPAFTIMVEGVNQEEAGEVWEDYAKDIKAKAKYDKSTMEYFSDDAKLKKLSDNTVDVYAKVMPFGDKQQLVVWFDLGGAYVSAESDKSQIKVAESIVARYKERVKLYLLEKELDEAEDVLKDAEKNLKGVNKDIDKAKDDIQEYTQKLAEAEEELKKWTAMKPEAEGKVKKADEAVRALENKIKKLEK